MQIMFQICFVLYWDYFDNLNSKSNDSHVANLYHKLNGTNAN